MKATPVSILYKLFCMSHTPVFISPSAKKKEFEHGLNNIFTS